MKMDEKKEEGKPVGKGGKGSGNDKILLGEGFRIRV